MKKAKKVQRLPKRILQGIVKDILLMMETEDGYPAALEVLEQLPEEAQVILMEDLSVIQEPKVIQFLWLVKEECDGIVREAAAKSLEQFSSSGCDNKPTFLDRPDIKSAFFTALATPNRLMGRANLIIALEKANGNLDVQYFNLQFSRDGIKHYFRISDVNKQNFIDENATADTGFIPITLEESIHLLKDAYRFNQVFRSRPARGVTQYKYLLDSPIELDDEGARQLAARLSESDQKPDTTINAFFVALRNFDWGAVYDLMSNSSAVRGTSSREAFISKKTAGLSLYAQTAYLKSRIDNLDVDQNTLRAKVIGSLVIDQKENMYRVEYGVELEKDTAKDFGYWRIRNYREVTRKQIGDNDPDNPLNFDVYCSVYTCHKYIDVIALLDALPEVEFVGEFPLGVHYRWLQTSNPLCQGVDVTANIFGEFIITDEELIIFSRDEAKATQIVTVIGEKLSPDAVEHKQNYYLSSSLVYAMFGGEFDYFEDLLEELGAEISEGPIKAFTATYQLKNREKAVNRINSFEVLSLQVTDETQVFHEFVRVYEDEGTCYGEGFVAEYKLINDLLEITTFDHHQLEVICREFEKGIKRSVKLLNIEERRTRFSEVVPRAFQELPKDMREKITKIQLERWLKTSIPALNGMTPLEARESIEGCRLLWELFKYMRNLQQELSRQGINTPIDYRAYIKAINLCK